METFVEFTNRKYRESTNKLNLLYKLFRKGGLQVENHTKKCDDPYLFVRSNEPTYSMGGVRVYKIGDYIAFRVQKDSETHPYGRAYPLEVEEIFEDFVEDMSPEKAFEKTAETIVEEINRFFTESIKADKEVNYSNIEGDKDPMGRVMVRSTGTDYANTVMSLGNNF